LFQEFFISFSHYFQRTLNNFGAEFFSKIKLSSMNRILLLLLPAILSYSCARFQYKVISEHKDWAQQLPPEDEQPEHTVYLIGDCGDSDLGERSLALDLLDRKLKTAPESSHVIFLGDNIYPGGLPPDPANKDYELANHRLQVQIDILKDYKGHPVFIPGNHDWYNYGLTGLNTQEDTIEKRINVMRGEDPEEDDDWENYFLPDDGCSGPEVIEVNDRLAILVIDSQWWLTNWNKEPRINDGCETKSRKAFAYHFAEVLKKQKFKNVIIATHHPPYTYGPHGGHYTVKQHIFPLTDIAKKAYVPLPGLGSIYAILRGMLGINQDNPHPDYKELTNAILHAAKLYGSFIFVSGHEHNMQYIEAEQQYFVVSGGGSKNNPVGMGKGSQFAFADKKEQGFSQLDFYKDGSVWVQFWATESGNPDGRVVFRKKVKDKLPIPSEDKVYDFSEYESGIDTISRKILDTPVEEKGWFHNMMLGKHYRTLYTYDYDMPVLDLSAFQGGVETGKRGGGNQTNSLRLENSEGRQWVMRAMQKDASKLIPYPFNQIAASQYLVEDSFLSTHPFAAFAIPHMASAIGVYHTNPKLYYIPKQPVLGLENEDYGGAVYLVEERPDDDWRDLASFGNSKKIIGTPDVLEKMMKNHKHKTDQNFTVRSRLFDIIVGDWDRHGDQWRWASYKHDDHTLYRPIPRDRDQPFAKYDGFLTKLISMTSPPTKQLKVYKPKMKNIKWETYAARYFDRVFLNELTWEEWEAEVRHIQENLTDETIDIALKSWPEPVYNETGEKLAGNIKYRRDNLMDIARKHYEFFAKEVEVIGTNKKEKFIVERLNNDETRVTVYNNKKGSENDTIVYQRVFYTKETKEIRLYGLNGDDKFEITGKVRKGPLVRIIGGLDEDEFEDSSKVSGWCKKTKIYDSVNGNELKKKSGETKDLRSNIQENNMFNLKDHHYEFDYLVPFPMIGFNPDDGVAVGASLVYTQYGFKKVPYAVKHNFKATFAFATSATSIEYQGDFIRFFGGMDLLLDAKYQAPQFVVNYFGLGNETINTRITRDEFDYNRVRQSMAALKPMIKKGFAANRGSITLGPLAEMVMVEDTPGRFITSDANGLPDDIFERKYYAGGEFAFNFANPNSLMMPTRGLKLKASAGVKTDLRDTDMTHFPILGEMTIYQNIDFKSNLVFATRIGTQHNFGEFEFFQAPILGGNTNLRGFRSERFSGRTSFYHNLDLRWKMFYSRNRVIPFSVGITGGFDYGRVWLDDENSDTWHHAYGGGLWIAPVDFFVLYFEMFRSLEGDRFTFKAGYAF
jgi:hypothetical protein